MTKFEKTVKFFNRKKVNTVITRKELLNKLENGRTSETKTDHYRKALELAGYIHRVSRGIYSKNIRIPTSLTWSQLRKQVYPNTYGTSVCN